MRTTREKIFHTFGLLFVISIVDLSLVSCSGENFTKCLESELNEMAKDAAGDKKDESYAAIVTEKEVKDVTKLIWNYMLDREKKRPLKDDEGCPENRRSIEPRQNKMYWPWTNTSTEPRRDKQYWPWTNTSTEPKRNKFYWPYTNPSTEPKRNELNWPWNQWNNQRPWNWQRPSPYRPYFGEGPFTSSFLRPFGNRPNRWGHRPSQNSQNGQNGQSGQNAQNGQNGQNGQNQPIAPQRPKLTSLLDRYGLNDRNRYRLPFANEKDKGPNQRPGFNGRFDRNRYRPPVANNDKKLPWYAQFTNHVFEPPQRRDPPASDDIGIDLENGDDHSFIDHSEGDDHEFWDGERGDNADNFLWTDGAVRRAAAQPRISRAARSRGQRVKVNSNIRRRY